MNISVFLFDISQTYPVLRGVNAEKVLEDARTYLVGKLYKKEIDFDRAKRLIFDNYDKRTFPEPKVLYGFLSQCELKNYHTTADDGSLVVITLPNKAIYSFEVTSFGRNLEDIKKEIIHKYGNVQVKTYPKGSVLIGKRYLHHKERINYEEKNIKTARY